MNCGKSFKQMHIEEISRYDIDKMSLLECILFADDDKPRGNQVRPIIDDHLSLLFVKTYFLVAIGKET